MFPWPDSGWRIRLQRGVFPWLNEIAEKNYNFLKLLWRQYLIRKNGRQIANSPTGRLILYIEDSFRESRSMPERRVFSTGRAHLERQIRHFLVLSSQFSVGRNGDAVGEPSSIVDQKATMIEEFEESVQLNALKTILTDAMRIARYRTSKRVWPNSRRSSAVIRIAFRRCRGRRPFRPGEEPAKRAQICPFFPVLSRSQTRPWSAGNVMARWPLGRGKHGTDSGWGGKRQK